MRQLTASNDQVSTDIIDQIKLYDHYKAEFDLAKKRLDKIKAGITSAMTNRGLSCVQNAYGMDLMTISSTERSSFDSKAFKADHEAIYNEYVRTTVITTLRRKSGTIEG